MRRYDLPAMAACVTLIDDRFPTYAEDTVRSLLSQFGCEEQIGMELTVGSISPLSEAVSLATVDSLRKEFR